VILTAFAHRPGVHCGSTALADALRARGLDLSEPMVFGLGAGLGFHYLASPALSPSRIFQGRSAHLERTACEVLGAPVRERTEDDPARAWNEVKAALERGIAPILATDLAELPYWRSRTPFGGHRVVLAGHDEGRGIALVADTDRPGLEEVPLAALARARASVSPPFGQPGNPWLEVDAPPRPRPLDESIRDSLRRQSRDMLLEVDGLPGVSALERFAADLPGWPAEARDEEDRAFCFRYASQVIEKRGTGGGLFRRMYARFLGEAEGALPALGGQRLREAMEEIAAGWTRLSAAFRDAAGEAGAGLRAPALALAGDLARRERRFHEDLAARVP
jgi:hypothetical protein